MTDRRVRGSSVWRRGQSLIAAVVGWTWAGPPGAISCVALTTLVRPAGRVRLLRHRVRMRQRQADLLAAAAVDLRAGASTPAALGTDPLLAGPRHLVTGLAESGAPLAPLLSRLAGAAAEEAQTTRDLIAGLAGVDAAALVLCVLPVTTLLLGEAVGAHPLSTLLSSAPGHLLTAAGLSLAAAGRAWMRRLVMRAADEQA